MADGNPGFNSFSNDGSFLEMFKKLQDEKQKSEAPSTTASAALPPVSKPKPVVMKLTAMKRKNPFLAKPIGIRDKAFSQGEASDEDNPGPSKPGKRDPKMAEDVGSSSRGNSTTLKPDGVPKPVVPSDSPATAKPSSSPSAPSQSSTTPLAGKKRKRSRWSDAPPPEAALSEDDKVIASAMASFGQEAPSNPLPKSQQSLTPAQLQQLQEQIEMNKLVARIRAVTQEPAVHKKKNPDKVQYEYDSDEDTEGGTWEHKKRAKEMLATYNKALELTEMAKGKHHIGDFLPPEELERFLEKVQAIKEGRDPDFSDYKEHKLDYTNVGFRMLLNAGWSEGKGLGEKEEGIVNPINKGKTSFDQAGIGAETSAEVAKNDNAYDTYRKRMMLAYKFRPNPLNNPRRPYY